MSTPEAELIAAEVALSTIGFPAQELWDVLAGRNMAVRVMEDTQAVIQVLKTGRNPSMRHVNRTHRVSFAWLSAVVNTTNGIVHQYVDTYQQAADVFTKWFANAEKKYNR